MSSRKTVIWLAAIGTTFPMLAAALLLAGCGSTSPTLPQLTGNQGGLLPGMTAPRDDSAKAETPGYSGLTQQILPDGHILVREYVNGQRLSETTFSSLRLPLSAVYYINDGIVAGTAQYGPDGKMTQRTYFYLGSKKPQRVEEYSDGVNVSKSTDYWPNGNLSSMIEKDIPTAGGPITRLQEWYPNGEPKTLTQVSVERNAQGQIINELRQGRQTTWNEAGIATQDMEYKNDAPVYDYMKKKPIGAEAASTASTN